ncbi:histidine phosphatase family protein, partial [Eubacterium pyruvativorans]
MESRIILLRHGLTEGNQRRWFYGGIDIPLTEEGRQQLKERREAGVYPPVPEDAQVFTSGLIRTEETLELTYGPRPHGRIP